MSSASTLDICGRRPSPATLSSFHVGRPPRNKGQRYPADPPTVEEVIAVMHAAGEDDDGVRLRGLITALWRAGLRISEALALNEKATLTRLAERSWSAAVRAVSGARWVWIAGPGSSWTCGCRSARHSRSEPCSACGAAQPAVAPGPRPASALSFMPRRFELASGGASHRTSCAMRTQSRCQGRECHC